MVQILMVRNCICLFLRNISLIWIGLNDLDDEGTRVWVSNNESTNYTNFGTPFNDDDIDCMQLNGYLNKWVPAKCDNLTEYACQMEGKRFFFNVIKLFVFVL